MSNYTLNFDKVMEKVLDTLKKHFHAGSKAEVIRKGIALLKVANKIEETNSELIAKKVREKHQKKAYMHNYK